MSDEAVIALFIVGPIAIFCLGGLLAGWKRKKPNIRVPRETLWERTNRYHSRDA